MGADLIRKTLELVRRGMGVQAMKTLGGGNMLRLRDREEAGREFAVPNRISLREALHFVWSLPVGVLVIGCDNADQMREQIELARSFAPLDAAAREALVEKVGDLAGRQIEGYKGAM